MYKRDAQGWSKHLDFILIDQAAIQVALILACLIRLQRLPYEIPIYRNLAVVFAVAGLLTVMLVNQFHDVIRRGYLKELEATVKIAVSISLLVMAYMFVTQTGDAYSRLSVFYTGLIYIPVGYCFRILWKLVLRHREIPVSSRVSMLALVEDGQAEETVQRLKTNLAEGYHLTGLITRRPCDRQEIAGVPVVCTLAEAAPYICKHWIDSVYVDCPSVEPDVARFLQNCREMAVPTHYHITGVSGEKCKQFVEYIGGTTVLTTSINYATPLQQLEKRVLDLIGGFFGSLAALGIMAVVGPMIKRQSPGPILYRQERIRQNGKTFKIIKIRSMHVGADQHKRELMDQNRNKDGMMFKMDFDPRIIGNEILPDGTKKTGIGQKIRDLSLDEFPQFFNVLRGEMSLVGTRPPTVDEWEKYEFHHRARLACKPGITGMWQVSGRSEITDFEEVVKLDTDYISNWSMSLDFKILLKTVGTVFRRKGAM